MTNLNLINAATDMASIYCAKKGLPQDTDSIRRRVEDWYNHTDITDAEILAAAALEFATFEWLPLSILRQTTEDYFPHCCTWDENDTRWD